MSFNHLEKCEERHEKNDGHFRERFIKKYSEREYSNIIPPLVIKSSGSKLERKINKLLAELAVTTYPKRKEKINKKLDVYRISDAELFI
jgi:hypothetical protein